MYISNLLGALRSLCVLINLVGAFSDLVSVPIVTVWVPLGGRKRCVPSLLGVLSNFVVSGGG